MDYKGRPVVELSATDPEIKDSYPAPLGEKK